MLRPTALVMFTLVAGSVALAGCGREDGEADATPAVPGSNYPASKVCDQLPVATVAAVLPGAELDTSLPAPDSCVYAADDGDVIFTEMTPSRDPESSTPKMLYDIAISDAKENGADDVRAAPSLGDDGKVATNAADAEITAVWRRGDTVYSLQYSGWDGPANDAIEVAGRLAGAAEPSS